MRLFCKEYPVYQRDVAEAYGKSVNELTLEDFLHIVPASYFSDDENPTSFVLVTERKPYYKKTVVHRLNSLWVFPIALLLMPFKWLFTGEWGFSHNTKFGRFLSNLVGEE